MLVKTVERRIPGRTANKVHKNCNLSIGSGRFGLSGKGFGYIADGFVQNVSTTYGGSQFQLRLEVMRKVSPGKFTREEWYIEF